MHGRTGMRAGAVALLAFLSACGGSEPQGAAPQPASPTEAAATPAETEAPELAVACEDLLPTSEVSDAVGGEVELREEGKCEWYEAGAEHPILVLDYQPGQAGFFDDQVSALGVSSDQMVDGIGDQAFLTSDILTFTKGEDLVTLAGAFATGALDEGELLDLAGKAASRL